MKKKFSSTLDRFNSDLWHFYLPVPVDISSYFIENKKKRLKCTLNGQITFQCALMPYGEGKYFINVNKERRRKLKIETGDDVEVVLMPDDSKYGLPMPEEFSELLKIDEEGNRIFHELTPGKQRNLLFIVGKPKSSDKRLEKAVVVIEHLKSTKGKINFKDLNQALRDASRR